MTTARLTSWYAEQLLSLLLGGAAWSTAVTPHLALLTSIDEADAVTEPVDAAYARAPMTLSICDAAVMRNTSAVAFAELGAPIAVAGVGLYSAAVGGQLLVVHMFDAPVSIALGRVARIDAEQWRVQVGGAIVSNVLDELFNHTLHAEACTITTDTRLALLTNYVSPTTWSEQSGAGYARLSVAWSAASAATVRNAAATQFAAAAVDWPTATHLALLDAGADDRLLGVVQFSPALVPEPGRPFRFDAGALRVRLV